MICFSQDMSMRSEIPGEGDTVAEAVEEEEVRVLDEDVDERLEVSLLSALSVVLGLLLVLLVSPD